MGFGGPEIVNHLDQLGKRGAVLQVFWTLKFGGSWNTSA